MSPIKVAPSLLAANFTKLGEEIHLIEEAGADILHLDIMDGHFVPNITFGPPVVQAIRTITKMFLESHLMISNPLPFLKPFAEAGSNSIIIHAESSGNTSDLLKHIRNLGCQAGISIKPKTPLENILPFFPLLDVILFMSVEPGFGGQSFMPEILPKVTQAKKIIQKNNLSIDLEIDGGIGLETAALAVSAGINVLIAGTAIFGKPNPAEIIAKLKNNIYNS